MKKLIATLAFTSVLASQPLFSHAAESNDTLSHGDIGPEVKQLQKKLINKGYYKAKHTTNFYNVDIKKSVMKLQKDAGLKKDGVMGKRTYQALTTVKSNSKVAGISTSASADELINEAKKYSGISYKWGGESPSGFDCSGFLVYVFNKALGQDLPRTVADIHKQGTSVSEPQRGDIVFFETYKAGPSHAGIYLGDNKFIHASSSKGISVADLTSSYWSPRYLGAKHIITK
ncbi:C40 family peptidase [Priestia koreensis]|uniref:C40 family peptidase n=1 Tax=Priestia koreensis TaxID=284581 RepID=UPI00203A8819|nr:NlpC/P60 family protein [Priestia koreensis]MCM3004265.1 NlpC/P60 family protein [Priestia koreensis]